VIKSRFLLALCLAAPLSGCMTLTVARVTGPAVQNYYFVGESKYEALRTDAERRALLLRRPMMHISQPAAVTLGRRYRFVPVCGNGPALARGEVRTAATGLSVALSC
jgi:hypothetical protein